MNEETTSIAFQEYLLRKMTEKQSAPLTDYNRGAVAMLLEMHDVYQQLLNNQLYTPSKPDEE
ncbi:hypothetical protein [Enterococcus faecalis]|uniref:hypothetical protein n=1 Tax=Enterococcus faecalis TaxID=1351 RepID=UPI001A966664|nr:hypothetical protein [Enterococcus faecalis]MBO1138041.1 hypothetical protein [Enterococcus faecalis]